MKEAAVITTHSGAVQVKFQESFEVPEHWKNLNSTARNLDEEESLRLKVLPVEGQSPEELDFSWETTDFTKEALLLQLMFSRPALISSRE